MHKTATKYAAELDAVGYDAAKVAEIETLAVDLDKADQHQEKFKGSRGVITQTRIRTHNTLWDITVAVSRVGKRIFKDNAARYNLYLLPASDENPAELSITGAVSDSVGGNPIEDAEVAIASENISVFTDSNGNFAIANLADGSYTLDVSAIGYTPQTINDVAVDGSDNEPTGLNIQLVATS